MTGVVDVHAHAVPASVLELIERRGSDFGDIRLERTDDKAVITLPGGRRLRPVPKGMAGGPDRESWMTRQGVDHQLVGPWMDIQGNDFDLDLGVSWARALNDAMAAGLPSIGRGASLLATVHPRSVEAAVEELGRAKRDLGAVGVLLATHFRGGSVADPGFEPFLAAAASARMPIVLHPPIEGPASAVPGDADFRSLYGRTLETSLVATRMIVTGLFERLPNLTVVLVHGGGFLPYQAGRLDQQIATKKIETDLPHGRLASSYLANFVYDTAMMSCGAVEFLAATVPGRVVVGTDYPFTSGTAIVPDQLAALDGPAREALGRRTVEGLFSLKGSR